MLFASAAVMGAVLMLVLRHPMRVALALIATMISLGGVYGLLGVHVIAVFQIMIYVGAVMVFMVYAIMLLDVRDPSFTDRYSRLLWPGLAACTVLAGVLRRFGLAGRRPGRRRHRRRCSACSRSRWSSSASTGCISSSPRCCWWWPCWRPWRSFKAGQEGAAMDKSQFLLWVSLLLFSIGLLGLIVRRNLLVMLMCMELMLNGVNLSLVTFAQRGGSVEGAVMVFLIFIVAAAEIAIAIPIVLLLVQHRRTLDAGAYTDLKG